jgi:competence protein ComEA
MDRLFLSLVALAALALGAPASEAAAQTGAKADAKPVTAVNINTATATELEALPGVGAATAKRIIEYRQKNGPFKKIEDLMNVQGVGEKSFLKLRPQISVSPKPDTGRAQQH